ncbi:MAG: complex I NDUFA9 subunit family protein [Halobacteriaceae archaeon]
MQILVTGGTGFVGTHLCRELADRGHEVTALSRDPDDADFPSGVETAMGDVTAYESIADAFEGQDAVVNLVALSPLFQPSGGAKMHDEVHRHGTENVVRAAEEHGLDRIVQMSALGADPDGDTAYVRAKGRAEEIVRDSSLDWVIVRPSVIFGEGGEFLSFTKTVTPPVLAPLPGGGKKARFQPIWVGDLTPMLADAVEADEHVGEVYELGGPEKLTLAEVAKLVRNGVRIVSVPMSLTKVGFKIGGSLPLFPFGPNQFEGLRFDNTTDDNDVDAFGVAPGDLRTLRSYLGKD